MKTRLLTHCLVTGGLVLPLAIAAQTPNLRPGGYEVTMSVAVGGAASRSSKLKVCVTKEDLDSLKAFEKDEDCQYKFATRSATRVTGSTVCNIDGVQGKGEFDIQFPTRESYVMRGSNRVAGKPGSDSRIEMTGRWASPSCTGYDD